MSLLSRRQVLASALAMPLLATVFADQTAHASELAAGADRPRAAHPMGSTGARESGRATPFDTLAKSLRGPLILPGARSYTSAKALFSPQFDTRQPAAVAQVATTADVATTLRWATQHGTHVAARSGGHSYVGASAAEGSIVVDTRALHAITYNSRTKQVTIGGGARLYDVHQVLAAHGRNLATGTCPTVGVSGLTSGGGLGPWSRAYGLLCDALISAQVILPSGRMVTVDARHEPDIFWALRGGGGGLVGVVTQWTFTTVPATRHGSFVLDLPSSAAVQILTGWARWVTEAPASQWANLRLIRSGSSLRVRVVGLTNDGDERRAAAALLARCKVKAVRASYASRSHLETIRFLGGGTTSPRRAFSAGSDVLPALTPAVATSIVQAMKAAPSGATAILDPLTGAVQRLSPGATAFPWRRHVAVVQWYTEHPAPGRVTRAWLAACHRTVARHSAGHYINYVEPGTALAGYLGPNTTKALRLRSRLDPQGTLITSLG